MYGLGRLGTYSRLHDDVPDGRVPKGCPCVWTRRVSDFFEDDALVEVYSVVCDVTARS